MAVNPDDPREPVFRTSRVGDPDPNAGTPISFTARLRLEPVAQDWDGTFKPLADLTEGKPGER